MSLPLTVLTTRLELIAATAETVSLEVHNVEQFATALGVPLRPVGLLHSTMKVRNGGAWRCYSAMRALWAGLSGT
jgi:hypothetical protein